VAAVALIMDIEEQLQHHEQQAELNKGMEPCKVNPEMQQYEHNSHNPQQRRVCDTASSMEVEQQPDCHEDRCSRHSSGSYLVTQLRTNLMETMTASQNLTTSKD
jgi:hypothetical protein